MPKMDEAKAILSALKMPPSQQSDICCYTLLAMAGLRKQTKWAAADNDWHRIHDIMNFTDSAYGVRYAENSRETFRKQAIHHFRNAAIVEDNGKATNSPNYRYRLTDEFLQMLKKYGTSEWDAMVEDFCATHSTLIEIYASK